MNHRVSSIRNLRTIKALRGEAVRIDLGKTFEGSLQAWMKRSPDDPVHREFGIDANRYITLSNELTRDYYTDGGVLISTVSGKWYFDVEQTIDGVVKTIFTGTIFFSKDITGSNSYTLGAEQKIDTVEYSKTTTQQDPNNSTEADDFVLQNEGKQLFWQVDISTLGINKQYWYSYGRSLWIDLDAVGEIDLNLVQTFDSYDTALAALGENKFFRWSEKNLDGIPSIGGAQIGLTV